MKKTSTKRVKRNGENMQAEYRFDYTRARPNRFAGRTDNQQLVVVLDKDVSKFFSTSESVNKALRALISAIPKSPQARKTT